MIIYQFVIPALLLFVPWILVRYVFSTSKTRNLPYAQNAAYLWLAAGLWMLSQVLPEVPISNQTDTFTMHTVGGVLAAVLYIYAVKCYQIKFDEWWQSWIGLFLFVSAVGVLNELFEFFLSGIGWPGVVGGDTWWDLSANTLGSFVAFGLIKIFKPKLTVG